ncbi:MAG: T9SS type A sorting domain-containing protein [Bacteroidales bacterium]|jgi:hypothetical protein|nr:T9SS type A sorting domain-containing protein [Bacteroidales bacterium]
MKNTIPHKIVLIVVLFTAVVCRLQGQVELVPLSCNPIVMQQDKKAFRPAKGVVEAVKLPFLDDFSNYTGFPNPALWKDKMGYVNTGFAINPPTIGVVTLDAIGADGKLYSHAESSRFGADTLTSQQIRLDTNFSASPARKMLSSDSLYFSFYYQPAGGTFLNSKKEWERIGNQPEINDSLVLEFGYETGDTIFMGYNYCLYILDTVCMPGDTLINPFMAGDYYIFQTTMQSGAELMLPCDSIMGPEMVWNHVWSTPGCSIDQWLQLNTLEYFKQVLIPITKPEYFRNNFQFRFRNYASLGSQELTAWKGNVDQWNIDYIQLDILRRLVDQHHEDVAFVEPSANIIFPYREMPWKQYSNTNNLSNKFSNKLVNISNSIKNTIYEYSVYKNGSVLYNYPGNSENAYPYYPNSFVTTLAHAQPPINFTIPYDSADSAEVTIVHTFQVTGGVGDMRHQNDTCVQNLHFYNYYAYDDGSAESGITINSTSPSPHIYFSCRFQLQFPDTLRCVRMWFNPVLNNTNHLPFTLMAWSDNNGKPGTVIASREQQYPNYADNYEEFVNYYFDEPVPISGKFHVGFYINTANPFSLGFDQNSDARDYFFTKTGSTWDSVIFRGAPMIRPVVGKYYDQLNITETVPTKGIKCYPNPTQDILHIEIPEAYSANSQIAVFNLYGQKLGEFPVNNAYETISLSRYPAGIYFIRLMYNRQFVGQSKIVKAQ